MSLLYGREVQRTGADAFPVEPSTSQVIAVSFAPCWDGPAEKSLHDLLYLRMCYPLLFALLLIAGDSLWAQQPTLPAVMCSEDATVLVEDATCTGSANCRACKNCGYCGHCAKRGGSCGVCSSGSRTTTTTRVQSFGTLPAARSARETTPDDRVANQPYSDYYLKMLVVETTFLNVRTGPGSGYDVIRRLPHGDRMTFLAIQDGWVKVRLEDGNVVGYVYHKYVAVL